MSWRDELGRRIEEAQQEKHRITVSKEVFERAHSHEVWVNPRNSGKDHSFARVRSVTSGNTYSVSLYVDEAKVFPTFPYVWNCDCKWGRERFEPCSHVIAVAIERGSKYDDEYGTVDNAREGSPKDHSGVGA